MFYKFRQNNSGGSFDLIKDIGITVNVIIEANSPEHANEIMDNLIDGDWCGGQGGYCSCCGERWYPLWKGSDDIQDPVQYVKDGIKSHWYTEWVDTGYNYCIHYLNGDKVWY